MKIKWAVTTTFTIILAVSAYAQPVTKDSIAILNQQKEALKISKDLNENNIELAKLENTVEKKTQNQQNTAQEAQEAADKNGDAANKLTGDAQDKKLANKASKTAKTAKTDAKKARNASDEVDKLQKEIESLKEKIAKDKVKLSALPPIPAGGN